MRFEHEATISFLEVGWCFTVLFAEKNASHCGKMALMLGRGGPVDGVVKPPSPR